MIKEEEYEVVGYITKTCICDKCMKEMVKEEFVAASCPAKYIMKCPECGTVEYINCDELSGKTQLKKKV